MRGAEAVRMEAGAQHVHRRFEQLRRDTVDEQAATAFAATSSQRRSTRIAGIRLVAGEHPIDRGAHGLHLGRVEVGRVDRSARSRAAMQQRVAGAQRTSRWSARCSTISRLGRERPVSTKLRWRDEMPASDARSSWLSRRRVRQSRQQRADASGCAASASTPRYRRSRGRNHYLRGNGPVPRRPGTLHAMDLARRSSTACRSPSATGIGSTRRAPTRCAAAWPGRPTAARSAACCTAAR